MSDVGGTPSAREKRHAVAFISHHSSQHYVAKHLKGVLARHGINGWIAPDDVEPGVAFDQAIIEQVRRSDLILLLFSEKSDRSRHVKRELMLAEEEEKLIYPVRLEDIDAAGLAYWLKDYQWFDWLDQRDSTIERLVATIRRQVSDRFNIEMPEPEGTEKTPAAPDEKPAPPLRAPPSPAPEPEPVSESPPVIPPQYDALGEGGPAERKTRNVKRDLLVLVGALLLMLLIIWFIMMTSPNEDDYSPDGLSGMESEEQLDEPLPAVSLPTPLTPGQWELTTLFTDVEAPPGLGEPGAQIRSQLTQTSDTVTRCLTPEMAANPDARLFLPENFETVCTIGDTGMTEDAVSLNATCNFDYFRGPAQHRFEGSYDANSANVRLSFEITGGEWAGIEIVGRYIARQIGECE